MAGWNILIIGWSLFVGGEEIGSSVIVYVFFCRRRDLYCFYICYML